MFLLQQGQWLLRSRLGFLRDAARAVATGMFLRQSSLALPATGSRTAGARQGTILAGHQPFAVAIDGSLGHAFVVTTADAPGQHSDPRNVNSSPGIVNMLDMRSGALLRAIGVGKVTNSAPEALVIDAGRHLAFVANTWADSVSVLDTRRGTVQRTISLPRQTEPWHLALAASAARLVVTSGDNSRLLLLDSRSGGLLRVVPLGLELSAVALDERARHLFVAGTQGTGASSRGRVLMLETATGVVLRNVDVAQFPCAIGVDSQHGRVLVTSSTPPTLSVLDSRTGDVVSVTALAGYPGIVAMDEGAGHALIGGFAQHELRLVATLTGTTLMTIATPSSPWRIAVDGRRHRALVVLAQTGIVVDTRTGAILHSLPQMAGALRVTADPHSGRVLLAADPSRPLPARPGQRFAYEVSAATAWVLGENL